MEKLAALRLEGMAQALEEQRRQADISQLDFEERFALLVERQWLWRENRALTARLHHVSLRGDPASDLRVPTSHPNQRKSHFAFQHLLQSLV